LLRRVDSGRAAAGYVAATRSRTRAAGRHLGRVQARAIEMREALGTIPAVNLATSAIAGEWSSNIIVRSRGLFMPSRVGMRRLVGSEAFSVGMRLRIIAGFGTIVRRGEIIASLAPAKNQTVDRGLIKHVHKRLRTRSSRQIEDVATGAVALTHLAIKLAEEGDSGTAHEVAQSAVRLVTGHVVETREARIKEFQQQMLRSQMIGIGGFRTAVQSTQAKMRARDNELVPVIPALRECLRIAVRKKLDSSGDLFEVHERIIQPLLSSCGEAEAAIEILTFAIPTDPKKTSAGSGPMTELLRYAGVRALELRSSNSFDRVIDQLDRLARNSDSTGDAVEVTSVLAATACRFDVRLATQAINRALIQIQANESESKAVGLRIYALWRVGAAGLTCGALSVAVHVARRLVEHGEQNVLISLASNEEMTAMEAFRSNLRDGYLGEQGIDALKGFGRFFAGLVPMLEAEMTDEETGLQG
jgi:hypothetical protein